MGSPVTADEADDSYRTLGVGRSLPSSTTPNIRVADAAGEAAQAGHEVRSLEEGGLRALQTNRKCPSFEFGALAATAVTPIHARIGNESNCANEQESFK
jgi:hypothetical protein